MTHDDEGFALSLVPVRVYEFVGGEMLYDRDCPEPFLAARIRDPRESARRYLKAWRAQCRAILIRTLATF